MSIERLDYLKDLDSFYYLDNWSVRDKELVYYFQLEKDKDKFYEGGILLVPLVENEFVIPVYKNTTGELLYDFDFFPDWFKEIASIAVKTHYYKTRIRNLFKEGENEGV